jgi:hypothetical protein
VTAPSEDLIDRLAAAAVECKALLAEVHGATKDLRAAIAEGREAKVRFEQEFKDWIVEKWSSLEAIDLMAKIKESYQHWIDLTADVDETMDSLHRLARKANRMAVEIGVK